MGVIQQDTNEQETTSSEVIEETKSEAQADGDGGNTGDSSEAVPEGE